MAESRQDPHAAATCATCGRSTPPRAVLCTRCARRLSTAEPMLANGPAGLDRAWFSAPLEGVARDLVCALKFRQLQPVAELMAERIEWLAPAHMLSGIIVPVPTAEVRRRAAGFDPAAQIAAALAERTGSALALCLKRAHDRVAGANSSPRAHVPMMRASAAAPRSVLLIDDILVTGASITAAARALRAAGASRVVAITFARREQPREE